MTDVKAGQGQSEPGDHGSLHAEPVFDALIHHQGPGPVASVPPLWSTVMNSPKLILASLLMIFVAIGLGSVEIQDSQIT
jgi:hypothetical protein